MKYQAYSVAAVNDDYSVFEFISIGLVGKVRKRVIFRPTRFPDVFDLALGDVIPGSNNVDDKTVTNNGDRNKVLATVARIIQVYTEAHPDRWVYFSGNTNVRIRLYRIAITINIKELSKRFEIYGVQEDQAVVPFENGQHYYAFLVRRKQ